MDLIVITWLLLGGIVRIYKLYFLDEKIMELYCKPNDVLFGLNAEYYEAPSQLMAVRIAMNVKENKYGWIASFFLTLVTIPLWPFQIYTIRKLQDEMMEELNRRVHILTKEEVLGVARDVFTDGDK